MYVFQDTKNIIVLILKDQTILKAILKFYYIILAHFRFYDSVLLDGSLYSENGTKLEMTNIQPSDSGEYTCRANNEVRGIYSNAATLNVRGKMTCAIIK